MTGDEFAAVVREAVAEHQSCHLDENLPEEGTVAGCSLLQEMQDLLEEWDMEGPY
jgi:hypothetical protein